MDRLSQHDEKLITDVLNGALAQRPSAAARELLLRRSSEEGLINALGMLHTNHRQALIPTMIDWLGCTEDYPRIWGEYYLNRWTGQGFLRDWENYRPGHPTTEEARAMQPLWREWWSKQDG